LEYAAKDKRISVINQSNMGLSATRNKGIKLSTSEYILHIDSDDWIEHDMCELMYDEARKYNADIVTSHVYFDYQNKTIIKHEPYNKICGFNDFLLIFTVRRGLNSVCNKLIKRDLYVLNNIEHYEDISLAEDSSALLRLIVFSSCIVTVNKAFYHYDIKAVSMTGKRDKKVMEYIKALSRVEEFYKLNHIKTDIFVLLRFKIAYKLLSNCTMKSAMRHNYLDYCFLYEQFYKEICLIIKNQFFHKLFLTEKCFIMIHAVCRYMVR
jgi:glycosyltransferase involved in cell wall biosynthesis